MKFEIVLSKVCTFNSYAIIRLYTVILPEGVIVKDITLGDAMELIL